MDSPARETTDLRTRTTKIDRSSACTLTKARSGTHTSVVAVMCSQTQNGEETNTERWWPGHWFTSCLVRATDNGMREHDRGTEGGELKHLHIRLQATCRRHAPRRQS